MNLILSEAKQYASPSVDAAPFVISFPTPGTPLPMSGPLVYLLNIMSKAVISQLINEASVSAKIAEPIGVVAVSIFAQPSFKAADGAVSLIDILLAKFHVCCPVLWGIWGDETTPAGRARTGWWKEAGSWVSEQRHMERMRGLAAGYSALALRDFSKSKNDNPYPPVNFWKTMSYIVNTPPEGMQATHWVVLKALVDGSIARFVQFYGYAALAVLRRALVELPALTDGGGSARQAVEVMPRTIERDMGLRL